MVQPGSTQSPILVVDDNPTIVLLLQEILAAEGYPVDTASDGAEALQYLKTRRPDLIFLDLDMPRVDGYEVCRRVKQDASTKLIPVVIVTAEPGFQARLHAWEVGADGYLPKPFQRAEILARCRSLLRTKRLIDNLDPAEATMFALARTVEAKSPYTHGHSERVKDYALRLAQRLGFSDQEAEVLGKGALLHDIGKIAVPDAILNKPGPLTAPEFERIKEHTIQGVRIVEPLPSMAAALPLIRWHHERPDGQGYPDGLGGDELPKFVRVLSVADVYDSLISERPYRGAIHPERGLEMLIQGARCGGLDAEIVRSFCDMLRGDGLADGLDVPQNAETSPYGGSVSIVSHP
jgi:putative two-component system response regulator